MSGPPMKGPYSPERIRERVVRARITDRTPTTADAAWEALRMDLDGPRLSQEAAIARHRPLIEAEARAEPRAERLPLNSTIHEWQNSLRSIDRTLERVIESPSDGHIPIWSREDRRTITLLCNQMDAIVISRARAPLDVGRLAQAMTNVGLPRNDTNFRSDLNEIAREYAALSREEPTP